jgi:hypothetical protein
MKYLDKFVQYIKENKELDFNLVRNEYLVPIKHLGVEINISEGLVTNGDFQGYNRFRINFNYEKFNRVDDNKNCVDKRIWELLDEILMFKNVIDSYGGNNVSIWLGPTYIYIDIFSKIEEDYKYLTQKLYDDLNTPYNKKVHFDISQEKDSVMVYINGTKRIWNSFLRDYPIDLSKFDLEFFDSNQSNISGRYWGADLLIKITPKVK